MLFYHDSSFDSECYRMSVHSAEIVTNAVWTTAERSLTDKLLKPLPVLKNLTKDIHWLCSRSTVKWGLYEPLIITDCFNKRIILKLCKNMTAEWVTQTFVQHFYQLMSFYHNSLRLRHSVCEQSMKESLSTFEDCMKECSQHITQNWQSNWVNESECWAVHLYILQL
jgi:hypothetical protein